MATAKETAIKFVEDFEQKLKDFVQMLKDKVSDNDEVTDAKVLEVKQHAAQGLNTLASTVDVSGANVPLDPDAKVPNTNATGADTINSDTETNSAAPSTPAK